jgi:farnesyl diphosphate synthase
MLWGIGLTTSPDTGERNRMTGAIKEILTFRASAVEAWLDRHLSEDLGGAPALATLQAACRHAALGGGKRLRPFLLTESAVICGATVEEALPAAGAVEMVHCYSLVHDDLPAMDDADLRRGEPSVHKAYDDAIAILAGDALLTDAFAVLTDPSHYFPQVAVRLVRTLAVGAGSDGMVGGQMMDLYPKTQTEAEIVGIQRRKTGALIEAAAVMGGQVAEADIERLGRLRDFARALGEAFQIVDDILDVTQTSAALGKPAGTDERAGKATFVSLLGLDGAQARVRSLTDQAEAAIEPFGPAGATLRRLARDLADRTA